MKQIRVDSILKYTLIGLVTLIFIFPIYWMIVTSLKPNSVIMRLPPQFLPGSPITDHYISVLSDHRFFTFYKNSVTDFSLLHHSIRIEVSGRTSA